MHRSSPSHKPYDAEISEIIHQSAFRIIPGTFIYAKVSEISDLSTHFMVSRDDDETTVVTTKEQIASLKLLERNKDDYALISLDVSIPFYCVGMIATVCDAMAMRGMNVLVVSTYSRDYIMVRVDLVNQAAEALSELGFAQKE